MSENEELIEQLERKVVRTFRAGELYYDFGPEKPLYVTFVKEYCNGNAIAVYLHTERDEIMFIRYRDGESIPAEKDDVLDDLLRAKQVYKITRLALFKEIAYIACTQ